MKDFFGRRGEVVWKKAGFFADFSEKSNGRRDYDCHIGWGYIIPVYLNEPIHTFEWGEHGHQGKAIPLNKKRGFAKDIYRTHYLGTLCGLSGLASPLLCAGAGEHTRLAATFLIGFFLISLVSGIALFILWPSRGRDIDIRLVLGHHSWGSSDPALWTKKLLKQVVEPKDAFGCETFEALAARCLAEGRFAEAMWAARLCAALEDEAEGERLTDETLREPKVQKKLVAVRANPASRKDVFGKTPPLSHWVRGNLDSAIFTVAM